MSTTICLFVSPNVWFILLSTWEKISKVHTVLASFGLYMAVSTLFHAIVCTYPGGVFSLSSEL